MIHNTQSARISQKQDWRNIYVIVKTMCRPSYQYKSWYYGYSCGDNREGTLFSWLHIHHNSPFESPLRNLGTIPLLCYKYWQTYLKKAKSSRIHKKKKKKRKKKEIERNKTHALKGNKRWRANSYHKMTPFFVLKYKKERVHEIFS